MFKKLLLSFHRFVCLKYGDRVFYPSGIKGKKIQWGYNSQLFKAWQGQCQTGKLYVELGLQKTVYCLTVTSVCRLHTSPQD